MKRLIACLLACLLLIPGMLVYASAEKGELTWEGEWVVPFPDSAVDVNFQYDDSKVYLPVIQVGIVATLDNTMEGTLGPVEDPFTDYSDGPFIDFEEILSGHTMIVQEIDYHDYDAAAEKLLSDLQLDVDTYCCSGIYNATLGGRRPTRHELISLAHLIATDLRMWEFLFLDDPDEVNNFSVYVSLVEKEVSTQNWDGLEEYRTDPDLFFHDDTLFVYVDLTCAPIYYPWSKEDFPELTDLKDVEVDRFYMGTAKAGVELTLTFNTPGRETLEDAMQKLGKRWEFNSVRFDYGIAVYPNPDLPRPDPDDTTIPDDTTAPVTDVQTTASSTSADETTASPNVEKPTSPPTGDAGRYVAIAFAAALVGAVGVVLYRRRRCA